MPKLSLYLAELDRNARKWTPRPLEDVDLFRCGALFCARSSTKISGWQPSCSPYKQRSVELTARHWKIGTRGFFGPGNSKMKILLVEDQQESRKQLQRLLEGRGHEVIAVESAEQAEAARAGQKFPFLILDWMLPGKSGLELCQELRAQARNDDVFILLVTARGDAEDLEQALEAGANDYLTKPLDLRLLNVRLSVAERRIGVLAERAQA